MKTRASSNTIEKSNSFVGHMKWQTTNLILRYVFFYYDLFIFYFFVFAFFKRREMIRHLVLRYLAKRSSDAETMNQSTTSEEKQKKGEASNNHKLGSSQSDITEANCESNL